MKIENLLAELKRAAEIAESDAEVGHIIADVALVAYIANEKITKAYDKVVKHYA